RVHRVPRTAAPPAPPGSGSPAARVQGLGGVGRVPRVATRRGGRVVPVGGGDVVAVGTVLGLDLPVAVVGVGRRTPQHLQTVGRLVDEHVDDLDRVAEVLGDGGDVGVERAEQEPAVAVEAGHLG